MKEAAIGMDVNDMKLEFLKFWISLLFWNVLLFCADCMAGEKLVLKFNSVA